MINKRNSIILQKHHKADQIRIQRKLERENKSSEQLRVQKERQKEKARLQQLEDDYLKLISLKKQYGSVYTETQRLARQQELRELRSQNGLETPSLTSKSLSPSQRQLKEVELRSSEFRKHNRLRPPLLLVQRGHGPPSCLHLVGRPSPWHDPYVSSASRKLIHKTSSNSFRWRTPQDKPENFMFRELSFDDRHSPPSSRRNDMLEYWKTTQAKYRPKINLSKQFEVEYQKHRKIHIRRNVEWSKVSLSSLVNDNK